MATASTTSPAYRSLALIAITTVFAMQSVVAIWSGARPFAHWTNTVLLMAPAIYWLLFSRPGPSLAATGVIAAFLVASVFTGGLGYILAFWVGLPLACVAGWAVARYAQRHAQVPCNDA